VRGQFAAVNQISWHGIVNFRDILEHNEMALKIFRRCFISAKQVETFCDYFFKKLN
jgi:hypothetical protein